jgi:hypothetical protein
MQNPNGHYKMPAVIYFIYFIIFPVMPGGGYPTGYHWKNKLKKKKKMGFAECKCPQARAFPK